jgi:hypothetical protein
MRIKTFFPVLLMFLCISQSNVFPLVTSRIEGRVVDEDTLEPIPRAEVYLAHDRAKVNLNIEKGNIVRPYDWVKITDENGYFRYDNLIKSEYLICVEKKGYTSIGPFRKGLDDNSERPIWRDRSIRLVKPGTKGIIYLKEGEIKYFEIKLAKDAALEIHYILKTPKGVGPLPALRTPNKTSMRSKIPLNIGARLYSKDFEPYNIGNSRLDIYGIPPSYEEAGLVRFVNLPAGLTGKVEVWALGYPRKTYKVQLEKGKTLIIEHILDYTKGPVIYGVIKEKSTGEIIDNLSIYLSDSLNNKIRTITNYNGEYWFGGFMPGNVKLSIYDTTIGIDDNHYLNIGPNEIRELNIEY